MAIKLDSKAQVLLQQVQNQTGVISQDVEKKIESSVATGTTDATLTAEQLEKALIAAMPSQQQCIRQCSQQVEQFKCPQDKPRFLSQILSIRVEREVNSVRTSSPSRTVTTDPYYTRIQMDPNADFMLIFNARNVDRNGRPLLMKLVAREGADLSKVDLNQYRTTDNVKDIAKFDVMRVRATEDYVEVVDRNEPEFTYGDPIKQVSLNRAGALISESVAVNPDNTRIDKGWPSTRDNAGNIVPDMSSGNPITMNRTTGASLDNQRVTTFDDRIFLKMTATPAMNKAAWLDDTIRVPDQLQIQLGCERGFMFEPGSQASLNYYNNRVDTAVPSTDVQLLGSPGAHKDLSLGGTTLRGLLTANLGYEVKTKDSDRATYSAAAHSIIFKQAPDITVGSDILRPLADKTLTHADLPKAKIQANKMPINGDGGENDQRVSLTLQEGFLSAKGEASVKDWKAVVGFIDEKGVWQQQEVRFTQPQCSQAVTLQFDVLNANVVHAANRNLEVRLFNQNGVPAERILVPFQTIDWDPRARG